MANNITNLAKVTYKYGTQTESALSNTVTTKLNENYSMKVDKISSNQNWKPLENLTYTIRIENDGTEPLYAVSIQDNLGDDLNSRLNYLENSAKMLRNDVLTDIVPTNVSPLTIAIPETLEPGEVIVITYVAKVIGNIDANITEITNELTVVGHQTSTSGTIVTVDPSPSVTIPKANYAEVRIEKLVDKEQISIGEKLTYTFRLENSGNIAATNVVITDNLPEKFVIESVTADTNGVQTTFEPTDYSLDVDNKLILPTSVTKTITVPESTVAKVGLTTVTINGTITE